MNQLTFQFPFKKQYSKREFYVSSNNFAAYELIENYPNWPGRCVNIFGPSGCGKTHLTKILNERIKINLVDAKNLKSNFINSIESFDCSIIDNYENNIDEKLLYSILNQTKQLEKNILITTKKPLKNIKVRLKDLQSRLKSFIELGISLPSDELLRVIISKYFSEKQILINKRNLEYILKNIDRSYDKVFKFIKEIDNISLSSGKSINIDLIKKNIRNE
tara:strand:- start:2057 stop:2713 length:657 start_codon:yes stop_codon:yes gene_type:complete